MQTCLYLCVCVQCVCMQNIMKASDMNSIIYANIIRMANNKLYIVFEFSQGNISQAYPATEHDSVIISYEHVFSSSFRSALLHSYHSLWVRVHATLVARKFNFG